MTDAPPPLSFLTSFRQAVAKATADESGGLITFKPSGKYAPGQVGIYGIVLPETTASAIALSTSVIAEDLEVTMRATFRFRAPTESALDTIAETLDTSWRKRPDGIVNGIQIILSEWASGANLGQDGERGLLRSANYYLTVHRPHPYSV